MKPSSKSADHEFKAIQKSGSGYKVIDHKTGKASFSKKPQSKATALAQLRAIEANKHGGFKGGK